MAWVGRCFIRTRQPVSSPTTGLNCTHQGVPTGFKPILVMDVWEHAFLLDYKPAERGKYIEAFFSNLDWNAVNDRLVDEL